MRVLVLSDRYPPYYQGGYELNCYEVTEGLRARGHTCEVLTTNYGVPAPVDDGHVHRRLHSIDSGYAGGRLARLRMQWAFHQQARRNYRLTRTFAAQFRPDVVFVWHMGATSLLPLFACQDLGLRMAYRLGSHWLADLRQEYVADSSRLRMLYRSALIDGRRFQSLRLEHLVMVGESLCESYRQAGIAAEHTAVIPSGIPVEWIANEVPGRDWAAGPVRVLYVGRVEALKGTDVALQAVQRLAARHGPASVQFDLVGAGRTGYLAELQAYITAHGLHDVVRFLGVMPRAELAARYADYDVLLFPTPQREGLPMTIVEAMAKGLVVVASDIGGPRDIIRHGETGLLVPPNDPDALAGAVDALWHAPERVRALGAAAIQSARTEYSVTTMVDRYAAFLASVVGRPVR